MPANKNITIKTPTEDGKVRPSRDGDQFHYLWAARRCLQLLSPTSDLVAVTIEGPSRNETEEKKDVQPGEEVIDVAEYYGSESLEHATLVRYIQLKHSTLNNQKEWQIGGFKNTLKKFKEKYTDLIKEIGSGGMSGKIEFVFATNCPIHADVREAIEDCALGRPSRAERVLKYLEEYTGLTNSDLSAFFQLVRLEGEHEGFLAQNNAFFFDSQKYLPGLDEDAPVQLKDLVARKATTEFTTNPKITKFDVLRTLKVQSEDLLPAPSLIELPPSVVPREQEAALVGAIVTAEGRSVLIYADGGVGKSIFATKIGSHLPPGSETVIYDCFGNGAYRTPSETRHGHKQALVQIANELAGKMLCDPLIPTNADKAHYFSAFLHRLRQSVITLRQAKPQALLCIVIDAADNAEMAAREANDAPSFVPGLIRESMPDGVRLVMLCRPYRIELLNPPPDTLQRELIAFSKNETALKLRSAFQDASNHDVAEFHRLSSHNPRVQSFALVSGKNLAEILSSLGPEPKTVEDTIHALLAQSLARVRDQNPHVEQNQIARLCAALAILRPMIPIQILVKLANVDPSFVRSFATDLGQALFIKGELLQFRDEPTETWFQENFKPAKDDLSGFLDALRPLAKSSSYVASTLPNLLLGADRLDELVAMALNGSDLPETNTIERRDIELQRLQFALRAGLRQHRYLDATKLALKAGLEVASENRQNRILQDNTDLAARFLKPDRILALVSRRTFYGSWRGAHHVYEASLLSGNPEFHADARSHLRMAHDWLRNWAGLPSDQQEKERIEVSDVAEMILAHLNVHGAQRAVNETLRWPTREWRYKVIEIVAERLIDHGSLDDLDQLAIAGANDVAMMIAIISAAGKFNHYPPQSALAATWRKAKRWAAMKFDKHPSNKKAEADDLTALAIAVFKTGADTAGNIMLALSRSLGTDQLSQLTHRHGGGRPSVVRAYALCKALAGQELALIDLAPPNVKQILEDVRSGSDVGDAREFKEGVGAILPWYQLWAALVLHDIAPDELAAKIKQAKDESDRVMFSIYSEKAVLNNEVAYAWAEVLALAGENASPHLDEFQHWIESKHISSIKICRLFGKISALHGTSIALATRIFQKITAARMGAEDMSHELVGLCRAILAIHPSEAQHYFEHAVEIADKIGGENRDRWAAVLHLATRVGDGLADDPELAYRLARCAELIEKFSGDRYFDSESTVIAISDLCPKSALAILSRWKDRGFGNWMRLLPHVIIRLAAKQQIDGRLLAALFCFKADWPLARLLEQAWNRIGSVTERNAIAAHIYQYSRLEQYSVDTWQQVCTVALQHNMHLPDIAEVIAHAEFESEANKRAGSKHRQEWTKTPAKNWDAIFFGLQMHRMDNLTEAHDRYKKDSGSDWEISFFHQAAKLVALGNEVPFIAALAEFPKFDLYNLKDLLSKLPASWKKMHSVTIALKSLTREVVMRNCLRISVRKYHVFLPLEIVSEAVGMTALEVTNIAVNAIAEIPDQLDAGDLFNLVGLLALQLSPSDAKIALDYELTRLERELVSEDGDGDWRAELHPPTSMNGAVAGYVWAALAAPETAHRWQAAHVVRALCRFACTDVLDILVSFQATEHYQAFVDHSLVHYKLHAQQWLLIALARAALDHPEVLARYGAGLIQTTQQGELHLLIRHFAAKAALALIDARFFDVDAITRAALATASVPKGLLPLASAEKMAPNQAVADMDENKPDDSLHFGIDMPSYWFNRLGEKFGLNEYDIARHVTRVILLNWRLGSATWKDDKRYQINCYRYDDTSHSHGTYPNVEDLKFYRSYHAMMIVAGELLRDVPLAEAENDDEWNSFSYWLAGHALTRPDGHWLADRRDPAPLEYTDWGDIDDDKEWRWRISLADFDRSLFAANSNLTVAGSWTTCQGNREQYIHIGSALVSPQTADALLRTLQTNPDHQRFILPDAGEDGEIDDGIYQLRGWIENFDRNDHIDSLDPWAADLRFPPLRPTTEFCQQMELCCDLEQRTWCHGGANDSDTAQVLTSFTWSTPVQGDRNDKANHTGRRLLATKPFLLNLLAKNVASLIIEIRIRRTLSSRSYGHDKADIQVRYPAPYNRYYLLKSDGTITTL
jgi:hypothetical protein